MPNFHLLPLCVPLTTQQRIESEPETSRPIELTFCAGRDAMCMELENSEDVQRSTVESASVRSWSVALLEHGSLSSAFSFEVAVYGVRNSHIKAKFTTAKQRVSSAILPAATRPRHFLWYRCSRLSPTFPLGLVRHITQWCKSFTHPKHPYITVHHYCVDS